MVALVLVIVVVISQGSSSSNSPNNSSRSSGGYSAPVDRGNGSSPSDDLKNQREKAARAEVESLRFEITQMQDKERDLQRQIDELEADQRRAYEALRRVRDPVNNQGTYFATMQRAQDLSFEVIKKAGEKPRLQEDIRRKKGKLSEAENVLRTLLNP